MRILKVKGKGTASAEPDIVTLSFSVEARQEEYADCLRVLNTQTEDLRTRVESCGIERTEMKTSDFGIREDTEYKEGRRVHIGYAASHDLYIELPMDKEALNNLLRRITEGRSDAEIRISFSVKDKQGLRKRVLADAVRDAKANAATLAKAAGIKLGVIQQIDYGWTEVHIHDYSADFACKSAPEGAEYDVDIEPADVSAGDSVTLVYEIAG